MTLKQSITTLFILFFSTPIIAQDYKTTVKEGFTRYYTHIIEGEYDKSMDYLPPNIFKIITREELKAAFQTIMSNPTMETRFLSCNIEEVGDSKKVDTAYFVKIKYVGGATVKFKADGVETLEEKESRLNLTKSMLIYTFGSDNVKLDFVSEIFTITPTKFSWAISKNGVSDWKFINIEPAQQIILEKILPKEIIEESVN